MASSRTEKDRTIERIKYISLCRRVKSAKKVSYHLADFLKFCGCFFHDVRVHMWILLFPAVDVIQQGQLLVQKFVVLLIHKHVSRERIIENNNVISLKQHVIRVWR